MTADSPFDDIMNSPIEIERKFLIRMPDTSLLSSIDGCRVMNMEQTYLLCESGKNSRVRRIEENGKVRFVKTTKQRISTISCYENEIEISAEQYANELKRSDIDKTPIIKTRYAFPFGEYTVEIDIYPFWNDRAILEIELSDENESIDVPDFIEVIKEVSDDAKYKNTNLAKSIPFDRI